MKTHDLKTSTQKEYPKSNSIDNINLRLTATIFVVALAVRIAFLIAFADQSFRWDENYYYLLANRLLDGYGLSFPDGAYHTALPGKPSSFQEPLYPLLIAGIFSIFGRENVLAVYALQAVFGAAAVTLLYAISVRRLGQLTGLLTAIMAIIYPPLLFFGRLMMTDMLFILILLAVIALVTWNQDRPPSLVVAFEIGILLGLGTVTRSVMIAILPIVWLYLGLLVFRNRLHLSTWLLRSVLIGLGVAAVLAPWIMRNYFVHQTLVPVSTKLGYNLYYYNYPLDDLDFNQRQVPFPPELDGMSEVERSAFLTAQGRAFISASLGTFVRFAAYKMVDFWRPLPSESMSSFLERAAALLTFTPVAVLGLGGLFEALWRPQQDERPIALLVAAIMGLWLLQAAIFTGGFKARIAIEPLLIMFTAYLLVRLYKHWWPSQIIQVDLQKT